MKIQKKASLINEMILHLIIIGLLFALFLFATAGRVGTKDVKQQVLEKQTALLIDSAESGMGFSIHKLNQNGVISSVYLVDGKVHALVADQKFSKGYPYFSKFDVSVKEKEDRFVISIK